MNEALVFHIQMMAEEGIPLPEPHTYARQMKIAA